MESLSTNEFDFNEKQSIKIIITKTGIKAYEKYMDDISDYFQKSGKFF